MLELLAPFAPFFALLLYALVGSTIRLFYGMYKAYVAEPCGGFAPGRIFMELLAGCVFGMVGGLLLDGMGVLKVGVGLGTLLCAVLGPNTIEMVEKKFGWTKKIEPAVLSDDQAAMPDLNIRQVNAMHYAARAKKLTNIEYQRLNNVSHDEAKYELARLVSKGRLKMVGSSKGAYYVPKRAGSGSPGSFPNASQIIPKS